MQVMKNFIVFILTLCSIGAFAQETDTLHIGKLAIGKKKKEVFSGGKDSSLVLRIDTLLMADRSQLVFYGKKDVKLDIGYAAIDKRAYIFGTDGKNNGTDFDIHARFEKLGALYVLTGGQDASNNGSRTFPNGDGGDVNFTYDSDGIVPQTEDKKSDHYLQIDTRAGGYRVNPQNDLSRIYSLINMGAPGRPLGNLSQGQVYSGTPGRDGKSTVKAAE
ncbi:hypothetical protein SAMN05444682_101473 [Parapedobacter indicus]|uniref:Uncharacterized protein n=2 Tax=Parapedobacter indicus TaxID=1477437 RepID=A0A1I3DI00_9SPHI|nr:hypothetical protein [Parapedobacter indicus]PPL04683.1 hypothetical protein CLV26_101486 [Parapedobacter indicus]SFH86286.1 hypothetical protein SAMN05444682_101473 [Parapedobacter indicus]